MNIAYHLEQANCCICSAHHQINGKFRLKCAFVVSIFSAFMLHCVHPLIGRFYNNQIKSFVSQFGTWFLQYCGRLIWFEKNLRIYQMARNLCELNGKDKRKVSVQRPWKMWLMNEKFLLIKHCHCIGNLNRKFHHVNTNKAGSTLPIRVSEFN